MTTLKLITRIKLLAVAIAMLIASSVFAVNSLKDSFETAKPKVSAYHSWQGLNKILNNY
jgi:ABC-type sulfate transport system permease component